MTVRVVPYQEADAEHAVAFFAEAAQADSDLKPPTLADWLSEPSVRARLDELLGDGGLARFEADTRAHEAGLRHAAWVLYDELRTSWASPGGR